MQLPETLLNEFAKITGTTEKKRSSEVTVYGTVMNITSGVTYVRFDGSTVNTPVIPEVAANVGDRVTVRLKNHKAILAGNMSSPAATKRDVNFVRFIENGFVIGAIDDEGNPTSLYLQAVNNIFTVKDTYNNILYEFQADQASFVSGNAFIRVLDNVSYFMGRLASGIRSVFSTGGSSYESEVITEAISTEPSAVMKVSLDGTTVSGVYIYKNGLNLIAPNDNAMVNNQRLLFEDNVVAKGTFEEVVTIPAAGYYELNVSIEMVPMGYMITSISRIDPRVTVTNDGIVEEVPSADLYLMSYFIDDENDEINIVIGNRSDSAIEATVYGTWMATNAGILIDTDEEEEVVANG